MPLEIITNVEQNDTLREDIIAKLTQISIQHRAMRFFHLHRLVTTVSINIRSLLCYHEAGIWCRWEQEREQCTQRPRDPIKFFSAIYFRCLLSERRAFYYFVFTASFPLAGEWELVRSNWNIGRCMPLWCCSTNLSAPHEKLPRIVKAFISFCCNIDETGIRSWYKRCKSRWYRGLLATGSWSLHYAMAMIMQSTNWVWMNICLQSWIFSTETESVLSFTRLMVVSLSRFIHCTCWLHYFITNLNLSSSQ